MRHLLAIILLFSGIAGKSQLLTNADMLQLMGVKDSALFSFYAKNKGFYYMGVDTGSMAILRDPYQTIGNAAAVGLNWQRDTIFDTTIIKITTQTVDHYTHYRKQLKKMGFRGIPRKPKVSTEKQVNDTAIYNKYSKQDISYHLQIISPAYSKNVFSQYSFVLKYQIVAVLIGK